MSNSLDKPTHWPTPARLSLGRTAQFTSTADQLDFRLDHALARDAVHAELDTQTLADALRARHLDPLILRSAIDSGPSARRTYLRRPDLGRTLHPDSIQGLRDRINTLNPERSTPSPRVAIILADGLSALAIERHALLLLDALLPQLASHLSLVAVIEHARVAVADPIGEILSADTTLLLIGERPGLSSPDSLGVYLTWNPRPGRTDAERNCISNIRPPAGLSYAEAAQRILHYLTEATRLQTTGILLKDPSTSPALNAPTT
jgi:ethanolamine ammonia-lyase small subunit